MSLSVERVFCCCKLVETYIEYKVFESFLNVDRVIFSFKITGVLTEAGKLLQKS